MHDTLVRLWLNGHSLWNAWTTGARPPAAAPPELLDEFTLGGRVPAIRWYLNDVSRRPLKWTPRSRSWSPAKVAARRTRYYGATDTFLYGALDRFPVDGKDVVIVGSEMPWYECICTCHGARVTTIEYRQVDCRIPGLNVLTPEQFQRQPRKFDVVVSISSIEHDGLGRYGDPINPRGDLRAMDEFKELLRPDGWLLLAVPIGRDALVWNAHRIYGRVRWPLLTAGWETVASFGFDTAQFDAPLGQYVQPVFALRPSPDSVNPRSKRLATP